MTNTATQLNSYRNQPDAQGHFGQFGGRYVAETLMPLVLDLEKHYRAAKADPAFQAQFDDLLEHYVGRPSPLYYAERLTEELRKAAPEGKGAQVWFKRDELNHTGAHKINNCIGQILLAMRMGKTRIIAETGAGQHGVATATVCARFGLPCVIYMGATDVARQQPNVFRMKLLGAEVVPVTSGAATLKDAMNEGLRDWVANVHDTFYIIGTAAGPHPYPELVRDFQSVIGKEAREQMLARTGRLPDLLVAAIGGGSNALGLFHPFLDDQILLAMRMGKTRIIAETGAGQHGVATATVCARFGLPCVIYMGATDVARQQPNVFRMKLLGAEVVPVTSGAATLKDAMNEGLRDWVANVHDTFYIIGTAAGPHPYPELVRDFQSVIGKEAREQMLARTGRLPDLLVAAIGGGSNALGLFHPFLDDQVKMLGVEAAGYGLDGDQHAASLLGGFPGILHGNKTYLLQDEDGQITEGHSISAGLDYPGIGPEHAWLKDMGRVEYTAITDDEALDAFQLLCRTEGIIPALEPSHAIAAVAKVAATMDRDQIILANLCGRGDKDIFTVADKLGVEM